MSSSETIDAPCVLCYEATKEVHSYCRPCWNLYQRWKYRQRANCQPCGVKDYRIAHNLPYRMDIPVVDDPELIDATKEGKRLKTCPVCHKPHRNPHSRAYCPPCKSAYTQYARKAKDGGGSPSMEEFRHLYDRGIIRPRAEGQEHIGRVVRGI